MSRKWLLFIALACGSAYAEPVINTDAPVTLITEPVLEHGLGKNLKTMGQSVASHTSDVITTAMGMIGIPYRRGGGSAEVGFDCSGFVRAIYSQAAGHALPRVARDQAQATKKIEKRELQPGDLVFFNTMRRAFSHVGIYVGDGNFIHAPSRGKKVRVESMKTSYWAKRFNGARRVEVANADMAPIDLALDLQLDRHFEAYMPRR